MRLIDADALMEEFAKFVRTSNNSDFAPIPTWNDAVSLTGSAPTVSLDMAQVLAYESGKAARKRGKWVLHPEVKNIYGGIYIECSECHTKYVVQHIEDEKYCRNCGAEMEQ